MSFFTSTIMNPKKMKHAVPLLIGIALCLFLLFYLFPVYIMVVNAFKTEREFSASQIALPTVLSFDNIKRAFKEMNYLKRLYNNIIVCGGYITLLIPISSMAAYVLAKKITKLNKKIYMYFLLGVIIPGGVTFVPLYSLLRTLHLFNYYGLILVYIAGSIPWAVFMYTGFMTALPASLEESAIIDGCNTFKAFWLIMFPLVKNGTITVASINLLGCWNDFLLPSLILQKDSQRTLMVSVFQYRGLYSYEYGPMFAALCLATVPFLLVFFIGQRYIISGVVAGSVKG